MARPQKYRDTAPSTPSQRQTAKRARDKAQWVEVARDAHDAHTAWLDALQAAIHNAAARGDETARACNSAHIETVLELLAAHFETVTREPAPPNEERKE